MVYNDMFLLPSVILNWANLVIVKKDDWGPFINMCKPFKGPQLSIKITILIEHFSLTYETLHQLHYDLTIKLI